MLGGTMDIQIRKLTQDEADALRKQYQDSTKPWNGEVMQRFASEEARIEHLDYVAENVASGAIPF